MTLQDLKANKQLFHKVIGFKSGLGHRFNKAYSALVWPKHGTDGVFCTVVPSHGKRVNCRYRTNHKNRRDFVEVVYLK